MRCLKLLFALLLAAASGNAAAHHSYAAEFDRDKSMTIKGVVREVWFKNPHIRYYVVVTAEDGSETVWDTRGLSPVKLVRQGWTRNTIKAGDNLTLHGHVGHSNPHIMSIITITLDDGRVLSSRSVTYDIEDNE